MFQRGDLILIGRFFNTFINQQPGHMYAFVLKVYNQNKAFVKLLSVDFPIDEHFRKKEMKNWKRYGITDFTGYYFDCVNHNERYTVINHANIRTKEVVTIESSNRTSRSEDDLFKLNMGLGSMSQSAGVTRTSYEVYHVNIANSGLPFVYVYYPESDIGAFSTGFDYNSEKRAICKAKIYSLKTELEGLSK